MRIYLNSYSYYYNYITVADCFIKHRQHLKDIYPARILTTVLSFFNH